EESSDEDSSEMVSLSSISTSTTNSNQPPVKPLRNHEANIVLITPKRMTYTDPLTKKQTEMSSNDFYNKFRTHYSHDALHKAQHALEDKLNSGMFQENHISSMHSFHHIIGREPHLNPYPIHNNRIVRRCKWEEEIINLAHFCQAFDKP